MRRRGELLGRPLEQVVDLLIGRLAIDGEEKFKRVVVVLRKAALQRNVVRASAGDDPTPMLNDYRNAVHYVDGLIGDLLREREQGRAVGADGRVALQDDLRGRRNGVVARDVRRAQLEGGVAVLELATSPAHARRADLLLALAEARFASGAPGEARTAAFGWGSHSSRRAAASSPT